ncbi:MAG: hypothetical protein FIA90_14430 [candidate division NC10 bacterium]|nr:hypothetical protein [Candidatus Methylomirabilis sp.]NJD69818.1 hypothetical protein [candidate division NC10 bacterium]
MRLLLATVLGGWILGTLFMAFVATQNFRTVDRLLSSPTQEFSHAIAPLGGQDEARSVLRYLVAELNRLYFSAWGVAQVVFGAAVIVAVVGLRPLDRTALTIAIVIFAVVLGSLLFSQMLLTLGRSLDFVPRTPPPPALAYFKRLHLTFTVLDLVKLTLCIWLLIRSTRRINTATPH